MEATVLSVGKSVLNGAVSYAKSALAEEVALQLGVRRDQLFITNELEMMQAFLMAAHDEQDDNQVVKVWVKQVRDVAYDVEDSLQEFAVRLGRQSWWRVRRTLLDRRHVAKQMKELRANVEDVSQRNMRYHLIKGSGSLQPAIHTPGPEHYSRAHIAQMFGIDGATRAAEKMEKSKVDLVQLINKEEDDLRVIAVWGTSADLGQTSIIRAAYEKPDITSRFPCRAWVRVMHPFNPKEFIQSLVVQFRTHCTANILLELTEKPVRELAQEFEVYVSGKRFLIVLNDLSTIEEWDLVKTCFANNKMGSRIIVSTSEPEVASLCAGQETMISELKQFSADQKIYAFHEKGFEGGTTDLTKTRSSSYVTTLSNDNKFIEPISEIIEDQPKGLNGQKTAKKTLSRMRTKVASLEESRIIGRAKENLDITNIISSADNKKFQFQVISVWGMGGLGKTTLIKDMYQKQELSKKFEKHAFVTIMRPFSLAELLRSLVIQLDKEPSEKNVGGGLMGNTKTLLQMSVKQLIKELASLLEERSCLFVLDDVSSTTEWDMIMPIFHEKNKRILIIVTTREESIAKHCSENPENTHMLKGLEYKDACELFTKKVFGKTTNLAQEYPELVEQANQILKKCSGLPLAVVTIGGFLSNQPKTSSEWRKLNEHISAELEMNLELGIIRSVLTKSYDGLPYHLKSCFLYMPIFPEDFKIRRERLVRRWTAEGYIREVRGMSSEEVSDGYFLELISRSMILPSQRSIHSTRGVDSCQVHDLMREIAISKSMEENLVFRLDEGCSSNSQGIARHLTINSNWEGDEAELESMVDMSHVRSVTVFGEFKTFFISKKMNLLRVLDLEDATDIYDHHLGHIFKFLYLRYLSLRGCEDIFDLPDSLGNLRQLETLDVRDTRIVRLPKSIVKLQKLNCVHAGKKSTNENVLFEELLTVSDIPRIMRNKLGLLVLFSVLLTCAPRCAFENNMNYCDTCNILCCHVLPTIAMGLDRYGVIVPRGTRKLKALSTLGVVNIARGKDVLKDIKRLTKLRKLGVTGISKKNGLEFCSTIASLTRLESLSIHAEGVPGLLGCLDSINMPLEMNVQSLRLYGNLVKLPEWIKWLKNLVKLKLRSTKISEANAAIKVIGDLQNLASLHLLEKSFLIGNKFCLEFDGETFKSLVLLELCDIKPANFKPGATPKLELLKLSHMGYLNVDSESISGIPCLLGLKEVVFECSDFKKFEQMEFLRAEIAKHPNPPVLREV